LDQRPDLPADVRLDGVDERLRHRLDRLRLPDVGPALGGTKSAEIKIPTIQGHDGLVGGLVMAE
jgi:hypothetical protein